MANSIQLNMPTILQQDDTAGWQGNGMIVAASQSTRPFWFDGRFLSARDLERDQNYFLRRQAALGRAAGFGVIHGLMVERVAATGQAPDAETIVIRAGQGITPGGGLVMISTDLTVNISDLADEESLGVQFGISSQPVPVARTRTGLFIVALRPVQFTANPVASYPTSIQASPTLHDGDIVEATAVSLVPYSVPSSNYEAATQNAAVARQIFLTGSPSQPSNSLLPLAMISIQDGAISWLDCYLVRRDSGPEFDGPRFGLADPATQQAFLLQYNAQLQLLVNSFVQSNAPARFAATDYFQAAPSTACFPLASISTSDFTQLFFPPQTNVRLGVVPQDDLPALIENAMWVQPIDLTLPASAYADLEILMLIPVSRPSFAPFANLQQVTLTAAAPQVLNYRLPNNLLRFFQTGAATPSSPVSNLWQQAIGTQIYGYYIRLASSPIFVSPSAATANSTASLAVSPISGASAFTLNATVSPPTATGTITFMDGANALGTVDLTTVGPSAGTAALAIPTLTAGTHHLTAVYNGDDNFAASTSPPVNQVVPGA